MTLSPTSARNELDTIDFVDVHRLIEEVKARPALWNKQAPEYADRVLRSQLWEEVCELTTIEYNALSYTEKKQITFNIQKKWRNLRDAFAKELQRQKEPLKKKKKKRKYIHFDALSFLTTNPRKRKGAPYDRSDTDEESNFSIEEANNDDGKAKQKETPKRRLLSTATPRIRQTHEPQQTPKVISVVSNASHQETSSGKIYDEDISFAEMLVPMLKKLDDDQKHFVKTEIMNIMYQAKSHGKIIVKTGPPSDVEGDPFH